MHLEKYDISIITPFYKGNEYMEKLFQCIKCNAENVSDLKVEWLIINDSPECNVIYDSEWVEGYDLKIIKNNVNVGIQKSRANGIQNAKGKYVLLLDQDDIITDYALKTQMNCIGNCDIVVANGIDENPYNCGVIYRSEKQHELVKKEHCYYSIGNMIVSPGQCLIKRKAIPEIWLRNIVKNNGSDDLLLWLMMLQSNCSWAINPEKVYVHVYTGVNVSTDLKKMAKSSMEVIEILEEYNMISHKNKDLLIRRYKMREMYEGKSVWKKLIAFFYYPDIAIDLIKLKLI